MNDYPKISSSAAKSVLNAVSSAPPERREEFEKLYSQWKEFRQSPKTALSSNPDDYAKSRAFEDIVTMGAPAAPLLMEKIVEGDFFCRLAVERIAKILPRGHRYKILLTSNSESASSEQEKAALMVEKFGRLHPMEKK